MTGEQENFKLADQDQLSPVISIVGFFFWRIDVNKIQPYFRKIAGVQKLFEIKNSSR